MASAVAHPAAEGRAETAPPDAVDPPTGPAHHPIEGTLAEGKSPAKPGVSPSVSAAVERAKSMPSRIRRGSDPPGPPSPPPPFDPYGDLAQAAAQRAAALRQAALHEGAAPRNTPPSAEQQAQDLTQPATAPLSDDAMDPRRRARIELAAALARHLGHALAVEDLSAALPPNAPPPGIGDLAAALRTCGLSAEIDGFAGCRPEMWPAVAEMAQGQLLLVLLQEGPLLTLYDPSQAEGRAEVSMAEFEPHFAGRRLVLSPAPELASAAEPTPLALSLRRPLLGLALGAALLHLVALALALTAPQLEQALIAQLPEAAHWLLVAAPASALAVEGLLRLLRRRQEARASRRLDAELITRLTADLSAGPSGSPPLTARLRAMAAARAALAAPKAATALDLLALPLFLALIWQLGDTAALPVLAGGVLLMFPALVLRGRIRRAAPQLPVFTESGAGPLHDAFFEAEHLPGPSAEDRAAQIWQGLTGLTGWRSAAQKRLMRFASRWAGTLQIASLGATLAVGLPMMLDGKWQPATLAALLLLAGRSLSIFGRLATRFAHPDTTPAALDALEALSEAAQTTDQGRVTLHRPALFGAWQIEGLRFRPHPEAALSLDIAALTITPGERLALLGQDSAETGRLLSILAGLHAPSEGGLRLDGVEMALISPRDLRRDIGHLGRTPPLADASLRRNLLPEGAAVPDEQIWQALDFAGLSGFVSAQPEGLELPIRQNGAGLTEAQRQQIGWARLWLKNPPVVLLEEATAGLDPRSEAMIIQRLKPWLKGRTAVIATQSVPILSLCDRVVMLQQGRAVLDGPRDAVLQQLMGAKPRRSAPTG